MINHTSDQHPWFQRARRAKPDSAARDFYVWSDTDEKYPETRIIFLDTEKSNWTWDPVANAYYLAPLLFASAGPEFRQPARAAKKSSRSCAIWLDMGVDGLRLDAVPYLVEREGTNNENLPETHEVLKKIRAELDAHYPDRMLLAEANQWPEDTRPYFGDGDECHMAFHFPLMPRMYMALAQEDRYPITDILRQTPDDSRDLPVGDLPAQPRRADARDGDRRGARLSVADLRRRIRARASTSASVAASRRCSRTTGARSS